MRSFAASVSTALKTRTPNASHGSTSCSGRSRSAICAKPIRSMPPAGSTRTRRRRRKTPRRCSGRSDFALRGRKPLLRLAARQAVQRAAGRDPRRLDQCRRRAAPRPRRGAAPVGAGLAVPPTHPISDALHVSWEHIDLQRRTVRIHIGKTDSWVVLPLHPELVGLANYFWTRKCRPAAATGSRPMRHCAASNCRRRR